MTVARNRQWCLARRPQGRLQPGDLALRSGAVPAPAEGEILVRTKLLCMDPTIRNFMDAAPGYGLPIELDSPVRGMVLGEVIASRDAAHVPGTTVWGFGSWSDYLVAPAAQMRRVAVESGHALPAYAHVLGTIGLTAHYGLFDIAALREGDTVLVTGAAGAVGSLVGQMARIAGAARVIGIAGGAEKCARAVQDYGYDACLDYRATPDMATAIGAAANGGIDVVFDNIGGALLEAALTHLATGARIALCGMIAGYGNADAAPGPRNLWNLVVRRARMQGFLVSAILGDAPRTAAMLAQIDGWLQDGRLRYDVDVRHGMACVPQAFDCLFSGAHRGRLLVEVDDAG
jgi:NADPH-dependent curcumin reductase CurA